MYVVSCQVMSRHSWKDQAAQPKIKYFTQVKARPPTFIAFVSGKNQVSDTDLRFLIKSLKEDFDLGGIPVRIMQRIMSKSSERRKVISSSRDKNQHSSRRITERSVSEKRILSSTEEENVSPQEEGSFTMEGTLPSRGEIMFMNETNYQLI